MKRWLLLLALLLPPAASAADLENFTLSRYCAFCRLRGTDTFSSETGQFVVHANPTPAPRRPLGPEATDQFLDLTPQITAVSAEKTKRLVLQALNLRDTHRDKVHIVLLDRAEPGNPIAFVSGLYVDRFQYQMTVPSRVEHEKFVRGIVNALLAEQANRTGKRAAELPGWLVEGMTQQALSGITPAYVGNRRELTLEIVGFDRLNKARQYFETNSCLTITELSFFNHARSTPAEVLRFEQSAHLFVHELLRLPNGGMLLAQFGQALPGTLNWQTAFYRVYAAHFQRPLDLEKWWALAWVEFKNKRDHDTWPVDVSLERLEALLSMHLELRTQTNALPTLERAPLQRFLTEVSFGAQKEALAEKVQQLFFLSYNLAPEAAPLGLAYQQAIKSYLDKRALAEYQPGLKTDPELRKKEIVRAAVKEFDTLDQMRVDLKAGKPINLSPKLRGDSQASRN